MNKSTYTYSDSEAGLQNLTFDKLSDLIAYIEEFEPNQDSYGIIFCNEKELLQYQSNCEYLIFLPII
jgi:hypothetical protein